MPVAFRQIFRMATLLRQVE